MITKKFAKIEDLKLIYCSQVEIKYFPEFNLISYEKTNRQYYEYYKWTGRYYELLFIYSCIYFILGIKIQFKNIYTSIMHHVKL